MVVHSGTHGMHLSCTFPLLGLKLIQIFGAALCLPACDEHGDSREAVLSLIGLFSTCLCTASPVNQPEAFPMLEVACSSPKAGYLSRVRCLAKGFVQMLSVCLSQLGLLLYTLIPCPRGHEALLEGLGV